MRVTVFVELDDDTEIRIPVTGGASSPPVFWANAVMRAIAEAGNTINNMLVAQYGVPPGGGQRKLFPVEQHKAEAGQ